MGTPLNYDIISKGRSHLYDLGCELQEDKNFNKFITCWPKFKFDKIKKAKIESYFHIYFLSHFISKYYDIEKAVLKTSFYKGTSSHSAVVDINLANFIIQKYKKIFLDHPTMSYHYQISQWEHEEKRTGIKIDRLQKLKKLYTPKQIEKIYSISHKIIVPSIASKNSFPDSVQDKLEYIPFWFPNIGTFSCNKEKNREKTIAFIGIVCPSKGIHYLVDGLNKSKFEGKLHLFGSILTREYMQYLVKRKGNFEIIFHNHIPQAELYQQIKLMDLAVMPSVSEGLPLSYLQALSLGIPVIASKDSSLSEVLGPNHIYETRDTDELAYLIESFFTKNNYKLDTIRNNKKYSLESYVKSWKNLLNEK